MPSERNRTKRWRPTFSMRTVLVCMLLIPFPFAFIVQDTTSYPGWSSSVLGWSLIAPCIGGTIGYLLFRRWGATVGIYVIGYGASVAYLQMFPGPYAGTLWEMTRYQTGSGVIFSSAIVLSIAAGVYAILRHFMVSRI